jgi:hypothetical protein
MKLLILGVFMFLISQTGITALENIKASSDTKETLEEIEKVAEDDLKKATAKIGEIEPSKGTLTLEEVEPLVPLDPQPLVDPQVPAANNMWEEQAVSTPVNQMKVFVDQNTEITDGKNRLNLDDLSEEMKVKIIYKTSWLGKHVARSIVVSR